MMDDGPTNRLSNAGANARENAASFDELGQAFTSLRSSAFNFRAHGPVHTDINPGLPANVVPRAPLSSLPLSTTIAPTAAPQDPSQPLPIKIAPIAEIYHASVAREQPIVRHAVAETVDEPVAYTFALPSLDEVLPIPAMEESAGEAVGVAPLGASLWDDIDFLDEDDLWDAATSSGTVAATAPGRYTYRWLQGWIYNECLPELRATLVKRGFISLHQLARALLFIGQHPALCNTLVAELDHDDVRVTRAVAHSGGRPGPIERAEEVFAPLLRRPPYPCDVLRYLKMDHLTLSDETTAFVMMAFELHTLTHATEYALLERLIAARTPGQAHSARLADPAAWQALVNDNLWLVCRTAARYAGRGLEIDDLIQEGYLGLVTGLERCEKDLSHRLMAYLWTWIAQRIDRAAADTGTVVRVPVHFYEYMDKLKKAIPRLSAELNRPPTIRECAAELDLPEDIVWRALAHLKGTRSLDILPEPRREFVIHRATHYGRTDATCDAIERIGLRADVGDLLGTLTERERHVLVLRYGLDGGDRRSLDVVGRDLGVTRERARQIEANAFDKLRRPTRACRVWDWRM